MLISEKIRIKWLLSYILFVACASFSIIFDWVESDGNFSNQELQETIGVLLQFTLSYIFAFRLKGTMWLKATLIILPFMLIYEVYDNVLDSIFIDSIFALLIGGWYWINCLNLFHLNREEQLYAAPKLPKPSLFLIFKYVMCRWDANGRSSRTEYWSFKLFLFLCFIILSLFKIRMLETIFILITFIPNLFLGIRRLYDTNHSAWWFTSPFILSISYFIAILANYKHIRSVNWPVACFYIIILTWVPYIILILRRGDKHPNRFGPTITDYEKINDHFRSMQEVKITRT